MRTTFSKEAIFNNTKFLGNVNFTNSTFTEKVDFINSIFTEKVDFINSKFSEKVDFINSTFENKSVVNFMRTTFSKEAIFNNTKFLGSVDFINSTFENKSVVNFIKTKFKQEVIFNNIKFLGSVDFINSTFTKKVCFINSIFTEKVDFINSKFSERVEFKEIEFKQEAIFNNTNFFGETEFNKVEFLESVDFKNSIFTKKTLFHAVHFHKEADFKGSIFEKTIKFSYTYFDERGAFWGIHFNTITFVNIKLTDASNLYFGVSTNAEISTKVKKKLSQEKISILKTVIDGVVDLNKDCADKIDLQDTIIKGSLHLIDYTPKCENWYTASLLKNEEIKISNNVRALHYKIEERKLYSKELNEILFFKWLNFSKRNITSRIFNDFSPIPNVSEILVYSNNLINSILDTSYAKSDDNDTTLESRAHKKHFFSFLWDQVSLLLSNSVNGHGENWMNAALFTLGVWIIPFIICYYSLGFEDICINDVKEKFGAGLFRYFNPTDYKQIIAYYNKVEIFSSNLVYTIVGTFVYILGKMLIPYGIYETVKAFRKFEKI